MGRGDGLWPLRHSPQPEPWLPSSQPSAHPLDQAGSPCFQPCHFNAKLTPEQSPCAVLQNAVVALQCSRRRLEGIPSTPSAAGTSTAPRPCAFLADALPNPWLAIPMLRIRCLPGRSLPAMNRPGSESFLVVN